jgi:signal transduction histidine kinase
MVAKAHKGELVIESKPGRGSRMRLVLGLRVKKG